MIAAGSDQRRRFRGASVRRPQANSLWDAEGVAVKFNERGMEEEEGRIGLLGVRL